MEEDQQKHLDEAINVVKHEAAQIQRALDASNLREALKHSSTMICELRTSLLSPRNYYELYMQVFDQLRYIQNYFMEEYRRGRKIQEMYEIVQHAANILPRLYLLITVGSVYIQSKELPAKEILKDLIEMVKGVQHPIRGLFLRYYLNKICKDKLPDVGNEYEGEGGDVTDSADFILTNLAEMNRLWVRMQHTANAQDKNRREKERNELRVTVGENIVRLSNLDGINLEMYQSIVLPKILDAVTSSKDTISQQYLMDCIVQVFPDKYHLNTLEPLLEACSQLQPTVDIKLIFINLMDRLSNYAGEADLEIVNQVDIFGLFKTYIDKILNDQSGTIESKKLLELLVAFLRFSLKCYPMNTQNVNSILESALELIKKSKNSNSLDSESLRSIVKLLSFPLETLSLAILTMDNYPKLMKHLQYQSRKQVATKIVQAVISSRKSLGQAVTVEQLLEFISPLMIDSPDQEEMEQFELEEEMNKLARLVHLVESDSPQEYLQMIDKFKAKFEEGGEKRFKYTFPALVMAYCRYCDRMNDRGVQIDYYPILSTLQNIIEQIVEIIPEIALNLNLQIVMMLSKHKANHLESQAFEFVQAALVIYQDEIADSVARFNALSVLTGTLIETRIFNEDDYYDLLAKTAKFASRQLRKADQCNGVTFCSHMFYNGPYQDDQSVFECLNKAYQIANICLLNPRNLWLFVLLLNKYLYYMLNNKVNIDSDRVNDIVQKVQQELEKIEQDKEDNTDTTEIRTYLKNTVEHIKARQGQNQYRSVVV